MERDPSSPGRHSKKAGIRGRSTSSSTTGEGVPAASPGKPSSPSKPRRRRSPELTSEDPAPSTSTDVPEPLTRKEQRELARLLSLGASPAGACQKLGLNLEALWATYDSDERFRQRMERVRQALHQNVEAALYRAAMEGKVSAQTCWMRHMQDAAGGTAPDSADMSVEKLRQRARQEARLLQYRDSEDPGGSL